MAAGFERSGTVLTVHLPTELDHPVSDEIRRESDRIIGHEYIKNMILTDEELIKTTTQKVKRNEEIKRILGR